MSVTSKLISVQTNGLIPELGNIRGPIINPREVRIDIVAKMVAARRKVYEHNPNNLKEKVELTIHNLRTVNFNQIPAIPTSVTPVNTKTTGSAINTRTVDNGPKNAKLNMKSDFKK